MEKQYLLCLFVFKFQTFMFKNRKSLLDLHGSVIKRSDGLTTVCGTDTILSEIRPNKFFLCKYKNCIYDI